MTPGARRRGARRALGLASALLLASLVLSLPASAFGVTARAYPSPGSQHATPGTQISFRDVAPSLITTDSVTVTGDQTGPHAGTLRAHSDGNGRSFVPKVPFKPNELVTVKVSGLIFTGSEGTPGQYRFRTAQPAGPVPSRPRPNLPGRYDRFRTRHDLLPASFRVTLNRTNSTEGDIFVASQFGPRQSGPAIYTPRGNLLFYTPVSGRDWVTDFRTQTYKHNPVLTWWQGYVNRGIGVGVGKILDSGYRVIKTVRAGNGLSADLHEFLITPQNTALITAFYPSYVNASSDGGNASVVGFDGVVQEVDLGTGAVLFEWHSLDHTDQIPLSDSFVRPPTIVGHLFDYFHINSAGFMKNDPKHILVSARNTSAIYKIDVATGAVLWRLGGKPGRSSFTMPSNATFHFQHDARDNGNGVITLFDDEAAPKIGPESRTLALKLDETAHTATLVGQGTHKPSLLAFYEGNAQQLSNGHVFAGWGAQPFFTEFDGTGNMVFDARFLAPTPSYRGFRFPWNGRPHSAPRAAVVGTRKGKATVFASWNGQTNARYWRVYSGSSRGNVHRLLRTVNWQRFETTIHVSSRDRYFTVQALDSGRHAMGTSRPARR
jgi:hypothetical protein